MDMQTKRLRSIKRDVSKLHTLHALLIENLDEMREIFSEISDTSQEALNDAADVPTAAMKLELTCSGRGVMKIKAKKRVAKKTARKVTAKSTLPPMMR